MIAQPLTRAAVVDAVLAHAGQDSALRPVPGRQYIQAVSLDGATAYAVVYDEDTLDADLGAEAMDQIRVEQAVGGHNQVVVYCRYDTYFASDVEVRRFPEEILCAVTAAAVEAGLEPRTTPFAPTPADPVEALVQGLFEARMGSWVTADRQRVMLTAEELVAFARAAREAAAH